MSHGYFDLLFGVQALRRVIERKSCDLGGALGVLGLLLPHQVATVERVLTAPRVRHLLADEVGLGKTVQALMIITALRLQDPALRVLVVVPNELRAQWRDEIWTRGHLAPAESDDDDRRIRLTWPEALKAAELSDIGPKRYDMLVVDEFHSLTADLQRRILDVAPDFLHFLLISATPPLQDPERRTDVLMMLEPARAAIFGRQDLAAHLIDQEATAAALLGGDAADADWQGAGLGEPPSGGDIAGLVAQTRCIYRRVVRTRRDDHRDYMPVREHRSMTVEPTQGEEERQRLMWRYFNHLSGLARQFDHELLAQRAIRSASSLQQRVTYLLGHGHEREGLLKQVVPLLDRRHGDSRYEALVELLLKIWSDEPDARVLVAAGDNLTVTALSEQLPLSLKIIGPPGARRPLRAVNLLTPGQEVVGASSLTDPDDQIEQVVKAFRGGEANILLASQIAKLGLNLQFSRHIILYSAPWDPQEVEQWIGRIDRIGNRATHVRGGEMLPILVYTIVQRGLVDERVMRVLEASSIFRRSISLDGARVKAVSDGISDVALSGVGEWGDLEVKAAAIARAHDDIDSPLLKALPWSAARARLVFQRYAEAAPVEPAGGRLEQIEGAQRARETALKVWLFAMSAAGEYVVRRHQDTYFLYYTWLETPGPRKSGRQCRSRGLLKEVFPEAWGGQEKEQVAFLMRRSAARTPPIREVSPWGGKPDRPLYFMHHGSPLHEDLVATWLTMGEHGARSFRLLLPSTHPALEVLRGRIVALMVGQMEPTQGESAWLAAVSEATVDVPGGASAFKHDRSVIEDFRADERLIRSIVPAQLLYGAVIHDVEGWVRAPTEAVRDLLDPSHVRLDARSPVGQDWTPAGAPRSTAEAALEGLRSQLSAEGRQRWTPALPRLRQTLRDRTYVTTVEGRDRELAAQRRLARAQEARPRDSSARRFRTSSESDLEMALVLARASTRAREIWLAKAAEFPSQAELQCYRWAFLAIEELRGH